MKMTYMSSIFSFLVFIPIIVILYLTITKRFKVRPVLVGILCYMVSMIVIQFISVGLNAVAGQFLNSNFSLSLALVTIISIGVSMFMTYFAYKRLMAENRTWRDGMGYGMGMGATWVIATIGITVFLAMTMQMAVTDGTYDSHLATLTGEQAASFAKAKDAVDKKTSLDFVMLGVCGASAMVVHMALSLMMLRFFQTGDKKNLIYAGSWHMAMFVPFFMATGGIVNIYLTIMILLLAVCGVVYIVKIRDIMGDDNEGDNQPYSRPSPLLGRR